MVMEVKPESLKTSYSIMVTPAGMVISVKLDAPKNVPDPMLVTPDGMVMEVKPVAFWNAYTPMLVS